MTGATRRRRAAFRPVLVFVATMALVICIGAGAGHAEDNRDPFEGYNRLVFGANDIFDQLAFRPLALVYRTAVPEAMHLVARNVLLWVRTPVDIAGNLLQGRLEASLTTFGWYVVNSVTLGTADIAKSFGLRHHPQDFGKTLRAWGIGGGPYLVWPLLGPANLRDAVGMVLDSVMDPLSHVAGNNFRQNYAVSRGTLNALESRVQNLDRVDTLRRESVDFYAAVRSIYFQHREPADEDDVDPFHEIELELSEELERAALDPEAAELPAGPQGS